MKPQIRLSSLARALGTVALLGVAIYGSGMAVVRALPEGPNPKLQAAFEQGSPVPVRQAPGGVTIWAIKEGQGVTYFRTQS